MLTVRRLMALTNKHFRMQMSGRLPVGDFVWCSWGEPAPIVQIKMRAAMMAFGGGALLFALSVELFGHAIVSTGHDPVKQRYVILVTCMSAAATFGGLLFNGLDTLLNSKGAHVTNATAFRRYADSVRVLLARRKLKQLKQVPIFSMASAEDLHALLSFMRRVDFQAGEQVTDLLMYFYFVVLRPREQSTPEFTFRVDAFVVLPPRHLLHSRA